jgi:hypothetical protein
MLTNLVLFSSDMKLCEVVSSLFRCYTSNRVSHHSKVKERFPEADRELFDSIGDIWVCAFGFSEPLVQHLRCGCAVVKIDSRIGIGNRRENCFVEMNIVAYGFIVPRQRRIVFNDAVTRNVVEN